MGIKECMQTIEKVCAAYSGNLQEHQLIQNSLATIKNALQEKADKEKVNEQPMPEAKSEVKKEPK